MKEIIAIIRMNKINATKKALSEAGFPAITAKKVFGRGKKPVNFEIIEELMEGNDAPSPKIMESISEGHRLIAKRMIIMIVQDDELNKAVQTIIEINQTGNMGDGKIFVSEVVDAVRVRTGEQGVEAV